MDGEIERQIYYYADPNSSTAFAISNNTILEMLKDTPKYKYLAKNRLAVLHDYMAYLNMLFTLDYFDEILEQMLDIPYFDHYHSRLSDLYYSFLFLLDVNSITSINYLKKLHFFIEHLYKPNTKMAIFKLIFKIGSFPNADSHLVTCFKKYSDRLIIEYTRRRSPLFNFIPTFILMSPKPIETQFEHFSKEETIRLFSMMVSETNDEFFRLIHKMYDYYTGNKRNDNKLYYVLRYATNNMKLSVEKLDSLCDIITNICGDHFIMYLVSIFLTNCPIWVLCKGSLNNDIISISPYDQCKFSGNLSMSDKAILVHFLIKKYKIQPRDIVNIFFETMNNVDRNYPALDGFIINRDVDIFFMTYWIDTHPNYHKLVRSQLDLIEKMLKYMLFGINPSANFYQKVVNETLFYYVNFLCKLNDTKVGIDLDQLEVLKFVFIIDQQNVLQCIQNKDNFIMKKLITKKHELQYTPFGCILQYVQYCVDNSMQISFYDFHTLLERDAEFELILKALTITNNAFSYDFLTEGYITTNNIQLIEYYDKHFCVSYSNEFLIIHSIFEKANSRNTFKNDFLLHMVKKLTTEKLVIALLLSTINQHGYKFFPTLLKTMRINKILDNKISDSMVLNNFLLFYEDCKKIGKIQDCNYLSPTMYASTRSWNISSTIVGDGYKTDTLREILEKLVKDNTNDCTTSNGATRNEQLNHFMKSINKLT